MQTTFTNPLTELTYDYEQMKSISGCKTSSGVNRWALARNINPIKSGRKFYYPKESVNRYLSGGYGR